MCLEELLNKYLFGSISAGTDVEVWDAEVRHRHRLHHQSRVVVAEGVAQQLGMASQNHGQGSRNHLRGSSKHLLLQQQQNQSDSMEHHQLELQGE